MGFQRVEFFLRCAREDKSRGGKRGQVGTVCILLPDRNGAEQRTGNFHTVFSFSSLDMFAVSPFRQVACSNRA